MTQFARHKVMSSKGRAIRGSQAVALATSFLLGLGSNADDLKELSVSDSAGEYNVRIVSVLNAPSDYVYAVITDYLHAYRINPSVVKTEILPSGNPKGLLGPAALAPSGPLAQPAFFAAAPLVEPAH